MDVRRRRFLIAAGITIFLCLCVSSLGLLGGMAGFSWFTSYEDYGNYDNYYSNGGYYGDDYNDGYSDDYSYGEDNYDYENSGDPNQSPNQPQPSGDGNPSFRSAACPFPGASNRFECGYLTVPQDWDLPTGPQIELAVAIVKSQNASSAPPLIYLEGGPGGSALDGAPQLWGDSPLAQDRDVILVDQRGTGYSIPTLDCWELNEMDDESQATSACKNRLVNEGVNLAEYHSENSAHDINALRETLGYAQIDLLGVSYGTRLALTVMREHPAGIRSVILDSVYPPHANALNEEIPVTLSQIENLLNGCSSNPACDRAYPELVDVFYDLVSELNNSPAEVFGEELWGDDIVGEMTNAMYDTRTIPYLPAFLYNMYYGEYERAYDILDLPYANESFSDFPESPIDVSDSEGMYYSVECHEEIPFNSLSSAEASASGYPEIVTEGMLWSVEDMIATCDDWGAGQAPGIENQAVISGIPTLVLNGEYDPVTPPSWAERAAANLSNSSLFIFRGYGHAVIDAGPCPINLMLQFLGNPNGTLNSACVNQVPQVNWYIDN